MSGPCPGCAESSVNVSSVQIKDNIRFVIKSHVPSIIKLLRVNLSFHHIVKVKLYFFRIILQKYIVTF